MPRIVAPFLSLSFFWMSPTRTPLTILREFFVDELLTSQWVKDDKIKFREHINQGKTDVQAARAAVDYDFETRVAQVAAATEQLIAEQKEAHADVSGKLRAALTKLEDRAGTTYATLQAIRQAEQDSSRPKAKRQRRTPTQQSTKEYQAEMQANQQQAAATAADHTTTGLYAHAAVWSLHPWPYYYYY